MKKVLLSIIATVFVLYSSAQMVERQMVVVEIATGTWCGWCPGAAVGADDLIAAGCDVAIIKNQNGDPYANVYSNARNSYYGISGYPTAMFDGVDDDGGGAQCPTPVGKYDDYRPIYDTRKATNCAYTADIFGTQNGTNFAVEVHLAQVAEYAGTDIVMQFVITESHIQESWQGCMTELNHVNRKMIPNQSGTPISLSNGETQILELNFDIDASWNVDNLEFVAFLQDNSTKEILQANMVEVPNLMPPQIMATFTADKTEICVGETVNFTDESVGNPTNWSWTFQGGTPSSSSDQNPSITYNQAGTFNVNLTASNATSSNTVIKPSYIKVLSAPMKPPQPSGDAELCQGSAADFTTNGVSSASSYLWNVEPAEAGTIEGSGKTASFTPADDFSGDVQITVQSINNCGESAFSNPFSATVGTTPAAAVLPTGDTEFCQGQATSDYASTEVEGATGYLWALEPREAGTISGNGLTAVVNWAPTWGGTAKVYLRAANDCGSGEASEKLEVNVMPTPETPLTPMGPAHVFTSETPTTEFTTESAFAQSFEWLITPTEAGTIQGNDATAIVEWNDAFEGPISLTVKAVNDCGESQFSEAYEVAVEISVGIEEMANTMVQVMPNPSNGQFDLMLKAGHGENLSLKIVNSTGSVVFEKSSLTFDGQYTTSVDLSEYSKGVYFILVEGQNIQIREKLMLR